MKFGFGLITCQRYPADVRTSEDLYQDGLDLAVEVERLGFDSIWLSEHHFFDDGHMASLLPVCAAIAARTSRITVGTGLLLATLYDPIRLAEDAATVDLLSNGRLVLGLGKGWRSEEFAGFGIPIRGRHNRLEEAVRVCKQGWSDGLVVTPGLNPGVSVMPKPSRKAGPPIWIGANTEPAVRRAARIADGFMAEADTSAGLGSVNSFARQVAWIRDEMQANGRDDSNFTFAVLAPVFAWLRGDPWREVRDSYHYVQWKYLDMAQAKARLGPGEPAPRLHAARERTLRSGAIVGTPSEVAAILERYQVAIGAEVHFVARLYWPGMTPAIQREAARIFAEEVIPRVRERLRS